MRHTTVSDGDVFQFELLEALRDGLQALNDLRLVPHNDPHVLRLKRNLRAKIAELEGASTCGYHGEAVA